MASGWPPPGIFIMFHLGAPFVSTPDEFSMCIGTSGVANPDRAYEERDRPAPVVPTRVEVRVRPTLLTEHNGSRRG